MDKELSAEEIASLYESEIENNDYVVENLINNMQRLIWIDQDS